MKQLLLLSILISLLICCQSQKESEGEKNVKSASVDQSCSFCGMNVSSNPKWKSTFSSEKKGELSFCCNRCMLLTSLKEKEALGQISEVKVEDYYDVKTVDGQKAFYVTGSDVLGPMGHDFVAFSTKEAAEDFASDHKGKNIYSFDEITLETINSVLNRK